MVTKKDYKEAVENPFVRREFVKNVDLEDIGSCVNKVLYNPNSRKNATMQNMFNPNLRFNPEKKSNIVIYPSAFSSFNHPKLDDFLGVLIDHEGYHAKEWFHADTDHIMYIKDLYLFGKDEEYSIEKAKREIRAYQNQIGNFNKRDFSWEYMIKSLRLEKKYQKTYHELIEKREQRLELSENELSDLMELAKKNV